jgi:hypothetical protein
MKSILGLFLIQTTGQTTLRVLLDQGVRVYLGTPLESVFIAFIIAILDLRVFGNGMSTGSVASKAVFYFVVASVMLTCLRYEVHREFQLQLDYPRIMFLAGVLLLAALYRADTPEPAVVFASLLALAWCASVSFGYATPVLLSIPLVLALIWLANQPGSVSPAPLYAALLLGGALLSFVGYQYP